MQAGTSVSVPIGGASIPGQIVYGIIMVTLLFFVVFLVEALVATGIDSSNRFITLLDYTAGSDSRVLVIHQDPSKYTDAKPLGLSVNERTGIEFAYSFYIYVLPQTFTGTASMKHVMHKGYAFPWPLMGPGVFICGETNTMRVIMNTYKNPYTAADVKNIPVNKWFHVVLNCYKGGLDVHVNGNLATRIPFKGTLPYQNFQDLYLFANVHNNELRASQISCLPTDINLDGAFSGYVSNLVYTRYALSTGEIQSLLKAGPSKNFEKKSMEMPPYLADDWWNHQ
jgi:hypothetical protein